MCLHTLRGSLSPCLSSTRRSLQDQRWRARFPQHMLLLCHSLNGPNRALTPATIRPAALCRCSYLFPVLSRQEAMQATVEAHDKTLRGRKLVVTQANHVSVTSSSARARAVMRCILLFQWPIGRGAEAEADDLGACVLKQSQYPEGGTSGTGPHRRSQSDLSKPTTLSLIKNARRPEG